MRPMLHTIRRYRLSMALVALILSFSAVNASEPLERMILHQSAIEGCNRFTVDSIFRGKAMANLEGVWRLTSDGGTFAVIADRFDPMLMRLIVVDPADHTVKPGTVMGVATPLAAKNSYDAQIFTRSRHGNMSKPRRFTLVLSDDGSRLVMRPVTDKISVDIRRLIPYLSRIRIRRENDRQPGLDGALRIYPEEKAFRTAPRYL